MSDPSFIYSLTQSYVKLIKDLEDADKQRLAFGEGNEQDGNEYDLGNQEAVVDRDKLFEILAPALEASSYNSLVVSGLPGSGKTHLAKQLAFRLYKMGYYLIYFSGLEMVNSEDAVSMVPPGTKKICIVVDDASWVLSSVSNKASAKNRNWWTRVRHEFGGAEVLVIWLIHQLQAIPPLLRNSNCFIMSAPTQVEYDSCLKLTGKDKNDKNRFDKLFNSVRKIQAEGLKKKDITLTLAGKKFPFRWAFKGDTSASGRIMLSIVNNQAYYYLSENEDTSEIDHIFVPKTNKEIEEARGSDSNGNNTSNDEEESQS